MEKEKGVPFWYNSLISLRLLGNSHLCLVACCVAFVVAGCSTPYEQYRAEVGRPPAPDQGTPISSGARWYGAGIGGIGGVGIGALVGDAIDYPDQGMAIGAVSGILSGYLVGAAYEAEQGHRYEERLNGAQVVDQRRRWEEQRKEYIDLHRQRYYDQRLRGYE